MLVIKRTAVGAFIWLIIILTTIGIVMFARGYRFNLETKSIKSRGILVANSLPNGSQIYVNGKFSSLTPDTLYLQPGTYTVRLQKEGYIPWEKEFTIRGEVVSRTDALLFSSNPSLTPLTRQGVINPLLSPSKESVVYLVLPDETDVQSTENGGIYLSHISSQALGLFRGQSVLIPFSKLPAGFVPEKTTFIFSPDEKNVLVFLHNDTDELLSALMVSTSNSGAGFLDATISYQSLLEKWDIQQTEIQQKILETLKVEVRSIFEENTYLIELSPAKNKLLYFATKSIVLPQAITPALIGSVPTPEVRSLTAGNYYIYDIKEDKNYELALFTPAERAVKLKLLREMSTTAQFTEQSWLQHFPTFNNIFWYSDSRHIAYITGESIYVTEYDGQNSTLVYSGPFEATFSAVSSDGDLIILTNINPKKKKLSDLYTVSIK